MASQKPLVVAITGASGAIYAVRLLQSLCLAERKTHVAISPSGSAVIQQELGLLVDPRHPVLTDLVGHVPPWSDSNGRGVIAEDAAKVAGEFLVAHRYDDFMTPIASGSYQTDAMVICPCSGSTLSGISRAAGANLIQRAAEVHLKERRKLVLVPRETPLSTLQLENMHRLSLAGAVMLPAMPGWYHGVEDLDSMVDFVVARILDQLDVDNHLIRRWKDDD